MVLPSNTFPASYSATRLYIYVRRTFRPDLFQRIEAKAVGAESANRQLDDGLVILFKIVLPPGETSISWPP